MDEIQVWDIRAFVYRYFAEMTRPPGVQETATYFAITDEEAILVYEELSIRHAFFLKPGTRQILMAWPFSAVETSFRVRANDKTYFANCAWDSLGIPATLHTDAEVEASCAQSGEPVPLSVTNQQVQDSNALVHFLLPFRDWYNDLPFT
jgi:hypothetical protein